MLEVLTAPSLEAHKALDPRDVQQMPFCLPPSSYTDQCDGKTKDVATNSLGPDAYDHAWVCRAHPGEQRVTANSSNRFGSPDPFQGGDRPQQQHMQGGTGGHPAMDIMSRPTSPDGLGGGIYSSYTMGAGLEGLICASPPPTRDGRNGNPRY